MGNYNLYNNCIWHHGRGFCTSGSDCIRFIYIQPDRSNKEHLMMNLLSKICQITEDAADMDVSPETRR